MNRNKTVPKAEKILDLAKQRIPRPILEYVARKSRSSIEQGRRLKVYESLNDKALDTLYRTFIGYETDRAGSYLELRLADSIIKSVKGIEKVDFRKKLIGASRVPHEIDVVGYNKQEEIAVIAESKATKPPVRKEHLMKWLKEIEDIAKAGYHKRVGLAIFISKGGYTDDAVQTVAEDDRIKKNGEFVVKLGGLKRYYIHLYLLEERGEKIKRVFPK